jgi:hypothetical protein
VTSNISCTADTNAIVFAMSAKPFASKDEMCLQNDVVQEMCDTAQQVNCSKICLVSAFGSGSTLEGSNAAYRVMHDFYLKEVYSAKEIQEEIVSNVTNCEHLILHPKVLCFEPIPFNPDAVVRSELAKDILEWASP